MSEVLLSKKIVEEEAAKADRPQLEIPTAARNDGVIEIAPIACYNDWMIIMPFVLKTEFELPEDASRRPVGIIVGATEGGPTDRPRPTIGDVVLFQSRSVAGVIEIAEAPYVGRKLVVVNERNILAKLTPVPFVVIDKKIEHNSFKN